MSKPMSDIGSVLPKLPVEAEIRRLTRRSFTVGLHG
jgi:hypothetical protein